MLSSFKKLHIFVIAVMCLAISGCGGSPDFEDNGETPSNLSSSTTSSSSSSSGNNTSGSTASSSSSGSSSSSSTTSSSSGSATSSTSSGSSGTSSSSTSSSSSSSSSGVLPPTTPPEGQAWSDPNTWDDGIVPADGDSVVIPAGKTILLDLENLSLANLTISGELVFAERDIHLQADWIMVHGKLEIGRENRPFPNKAIITLTGTELSDPGPMGMGTRGLIVHGGILDLHSNAPSPVWTQLNEHAEAGTQTLTLSENVDWQSGAQIVVAPTDFYEFAGRTEARSIVSSNDKTLNLQQGLEYFHWGKLQYVQNSETEAITLIPSNDVTDKVVDERAEVGNLTRNILIQGADDSLWQNEQFGAHVMVMYPGEARLDGVELTRVGQAGHLARYPFHWHLWSYYSSGNLRGAAENQYVKNSVIHNSGQRCIVIHGTNGVTVKDNICYDITGHGIFLEDAVERDNIIEGNLVLKIKEVDYRKRLLDHEKKPAGFWLTHPKNTIRNNTVADSAGIGIWYALPTQPLGLNKNVAVNPSIEPFGIFSSNVIHSTFSEGLMFDHVPIDDEGRTSPHGYRPVVGGQEGEDLLRFTMDKTTIFKVGVNHLGPIWDRIDGVTFRDFVVSDFGHKAFAGSSRCVIENNLIVGNSLNNLNNGAITAPAVGTASYHSLCKIPENIFVNIPAVVGEDSGAFSTDDYYITGVDLGQFLNNDNIFINAHPGYRTESPNTLPSGGGLEHFSLSGALWDPYGYWGEAGHYWVLDHPFVTDGGNCNSVKEPVHGNDLSCEGPYFGLSNITTRILQFIDDPLDPASEQALQLENEQRPVNIIKEDAMGNSIANWFIDDGGCTKFLFNMRNSSLRQGGIYRVEFPGGSGTESDEPREGCVPQSAFVPADHFMFTISNIKEPEDWVMIGVPFDGNSELQTTLLSSFPNATEALGWASWKCYEEMRDGASECSDGGGHWSEKFRADYFRPYKPTSSKNNVLNDAACDKYYHDKSNEVVWLKVCRGDLTFLEGDPIENKLIWYQDLKVLFLK